MNLFQSVRTVHKHFTRVRVRPLSSAWLPSPLTGVPLLLSSVFSPPRFLELYCQSVGVQCFHARPWVHLASPEEEARRPAERYRWWLIAIQATQLQPRLLRTVCTHTPTSCASQPAFQAPGRSPTPQHAALHRLSPVVAGGAGSTHQSMRTKQCSHARARGCGITHSTAGRFQLNVGRSTPTPRLPFILSLRCKPSLHRLGNAELV